MIKRVFDGIVLMGDTIREVWRNSDDEISYICENSDLVLSFANSKNKKRADIAKKMKISPGEEVIVSGVRSKNSASCITGFDLKRAGYVRNQNGYLFQGNIEKIIPCGSSSFLHLSFGKENCQISVPTDELISKNITDSANVRMACLCLNEKGCFGACPQKAFSLSACDGCSNYKTDRKWVCLDIEKI